MNPRSDKPYVHVEVQTDGTRNMIVLTLEGAPKSRSLSEARACGYDSAEAAHVHADLWRRALS